MKLSVREAVLEEKMIRRESRTSREGKRVLEWKWGEKEAEKKRSRREDWRKWQKGKGRRKGRGGREDRDNRGKVGGKGEEGGSERERERVGGGQGSITYPL